MTQHSGSTDPSGLFDVSAGELDELANAARALAQRGGDILMDRFHATIEISFKGQNAHDPVTEVDHAIEDLIRAEVHDSFPEHGVLGEERENGGPIDADIVWVIDPLDGTSNFINGIGMFACSIGILHRGMPIAGAMWLPSNRFLTPGVYHARAGGGLMFNGDEVDCGAPALQAASRLSTVPAGTGGVTGPAGRRFGIARTFGSTATELALAPRVRYRWRCLTVRGSGMSPAVSPSASRPVARSTRSRAEQMRGGGRLRTSATVSKDQSRCPSYAPGVIHWSRATPRCCPVQPRT